MRSVAEAAVVGTFFSTLFRHTYWNQVNEAPKLLMHTLSQVRRGYAEVSVAHPFSGAIQCGTHILSKRDAVIAKLVRTLHFFPT